MDGHPGGLLLTRRLMELGNLRPPKRILDLGAGGGATLRILREAGYDAEGIDKNPRSDCVLEGDLRALPYSSECFDAVIAECTISICGNAEKALEQASRVLKTGGILLLSDVVFESPGAPGLTMSDWMRLVVNAGFAILQTEDHSARWKEYYIECIWNGTAEALPRLFGDRKGRTGYFLMTARKILG